MLRAAQNFIAIAVFVADGLYNFLKIGILSLQVCGPCLFMTIHLSKLLLMLSPGVSWMHAFDHGACMKPLDSPQHDDIISCEDAPRTDLVPWLDPGVPGPAERGQARAAAHPGPASHGHRVQDDYPAGHWAAPGRAPRQFSQRRQSRCNATARGSLPAQLARRASTLLGP